MTHPTLTRWRSYLLLIAGMAVVGAYVAFSKVIVATVPVCLLAVIRFSIAAIAMLPWTFPKGGVALAKSASKTLFLESFFGNFLFSLCMLSGVARTSATAAGLIMSTLPAMVALFSLMFLRERFDLRTGLAIMLAMTGVAALTVVRNAGHGSATSSADLIGNLLMLGAVVCEAMYVIFAKRLTTAFHGSNVGAMQISAWINLVGLVLMLPLGLWQASTFDFSVMTASLWSLIVAYSIGASVLSTWLWLSGLKHVPANEAGVFTVALPVTSALVGVLFLHESLTLVHAIAFVCAVGGIVLITGRKRS